MGTPTVRYRVPRSTIFTVSIAPLQSHFLTLSKTCFLTLRSYPTRSLARDKSRTQQRNLAYSHAAKASETNKHVYGLRQSTMRPFTHFTEVPAHNMKHVAMFIPHALLAFAAVLATPSRYAQAATKEERVTAQYTSSNSLEEEDLQQ